MIFVLKYFHKKQRKWYKQLYTFLVKWMKKMKKNLIMSTNVPTFKQ